MNNYRKGYEKERRIVNSFREKSCIALRSAGSHSIIDVVVIDYLNHEIKLIQAKQTKRKLTKNKKAEIIERGIALNGSYIVNFELWD